MPADDRRAGTRHAGDERQHLTQADAERPRHGRVLRILHDGRGARALDDEHHQTAGNERGREDRGTFVQHVLDETGQERAGQQRGNGGDDDREREMTRLVARQQPRR